MSFLSGIVSLAGGLLLGGKVGEIDSSRKAMKAERRASAIQAKIEERQAARDRLTALRESQIARASAIQASVSTGTADSSGLEGQLAGIQSTTASNLAFSYQTETGVQNINSLLAKAGRYRSQAANYKAVGDLTQSAIKGGFI